MKYNVKITLHEYYEVCVDADDEEQAEDLALEKFNSGALDIQSTWDDVVAELQEDN